MQTLEEAMFYPFSKNMETMVSMEQFLLVEVPKLFRYNPKTEQLALCDTVFQCTRERTLDPVPGNEWRWFKLSVSIQRGCQALCASANAERHVFRRSSSDHTICSRACFSNHRYQDIERDLDDVQAYCEELLRSNKASEYETNESLELLHEIVTRVSMDIYIVHQYILKVVETL